MQGRGSNPRPPAYEAGELPLLYPGIDHCRTCVGFSGAGGLQSHPPSPQPDRRMSSATINAACLISTPVSGASSVTQPGHRRGLRLSRLEGLHGCLSAFSHGVVCGPGSGNAKGPHIAVQALDAITESYWFRGVFQKGRAVSTNPIEIPDAQTRRRRWIA